ncbi:M48 family metalloprotease [Curvibacter sp. CHRR-16]|uniref:M48 family metalloprotease n=1 Tax=Curvibacter sp. CHRR-16 TaxID=2835872 RepID=UPI001BDB224B|nr:M48 family metalloprotease [Curvibacter sp. CHRR-16]MBT0570419.1 M48 family metalloprotease [Curvibacter sp. CHRR-16]
MPSDFSDGLGLSPAAERRIGDQMARSLYRDLDYLDDPIVQDYVNSIMAPLLAAARARGEIQPEMDDAYAWHVLLGKNKTVNAFATPGGYFGLELGLLAVTVSRDELAAVLAHELSHVTQRHLARMMAQQEQQTPWLIGAMILGILAAAKDGQSGSAVVVGGSAAAAQSQLNFSRDMEREADRIGFGVATQAGYDPEGFVTMFDKLYNANRLNDSGNFPYLRTHPLSTERMADMQGRLGVKATATSKTNAAASEDPMLEHTLMAARAKALSSSGVDAQQLLVAQANMKATTNNTSQAAATAYAAAMGAMQLRDWPTAQKQLLQLQSLVAGKPLSQRQWRYLQAEYLLATNQAAAAWDLLMLDANHRAGMWLRGQAALALQNQAQLRQCLIERRSWLVEHPSDALMWQQQSNMAVATGWTLGAMRAAAESKAAEMDIAQALERMRAAQAWGAKNPATSGDDQIELSIIDSRVRQLQSQLKDLQSSKM